jgi:hypothetical protein
MDQDSYQGKLAQLVEIFQGDEDYAKVVLDKWLQKNRSEFEAKILDEVRRRLEGLNSIVPFTLRVLIDQNGVQIPGNTPPMPGKTQIAKEKRASGKKTIMIEH